MFYHYLCTSKRGNTATRESRDDYAGKPGHLRDNAGTITRERKDIYAETRKRLRGNAGTFTRENRDAPTRRQTTTDYHKTPPYEPHTLDKPTHKKDKTHTHMRKTTYLFIKAQGRATRRVLLESLAFRDLFGRLPRCPGEAPGGDAENIHPDATNVCTDLKNICTDVTNVCTDSKNICPDATNVCAETTDVRADATHAPDGEVEGLRPRHMAMLRLIAAYEQAADRAEAPEPGTRSPAEEREEWDGGEENHGADESGADCKRKEEKRRKETDKENAPSPPTPLSPKEKDKEKEREKKEKPAKDPAEAADTGAMPSQPAPQPDLFPADDTPHDTDNGNPDDGGGADTEGDKADTANDGGEATGTAGNAPARRRPGRKPAAPRLRLSREELSDERLFTGRLPFVGPAHARAMMRWTRYKQERGQVYRSEDTLRTCYARYLQLCGGDPATGLALVERSVANNWSGLFAPDNQRNNQRFMTYDEQREHDRQLRRQQAGELVRELLDTNRPYDPDETRSGLDLAGLAGLGEEGV